MISITKIKKLFDESLDKMPLLTLDEFFKDNEIEDSIAPNNWLYGRPSISDIYNKLLEIEKLEQIDWVRVSLHEDTDIEDEEIFISGDTIVICTNLSKKELEDKVDIEYLFADAVIDADIKEYSNVPEIPKDCNIYEIVWD